RQHVAHGRAVHEHRFGIRVSGGRGHEPLVCARITSLQFRLGGVLRQVCKELRLPLRLACAPRIDIQVRARADTAKDRGTHRSLNKRIKHALCRIAHGRFAVNALHALRKFLAGDVDDLLQTFLGGLRTNLHGICLAGLGQCCAHGRLSHGFGNLLAHHAACQLAEWSRSDLHAYGFNQTVQQTSTKGNRNSSLIIDSLLFHIKVHIAGFNLAGCKHNTGSNSSGKSSHCSKARNYRSCCTANQTSTDNLTRLCHILCNDFSGSCENATT
ncbi:MAG: hypothetical protein ACK55I_08575, partial [bacterium]